MDISLLKNDFVFHSAGKGSARYFIPKDRCTAFTIKQTHNADWDIYSYYLCSREGISKNDSVVFSNGELIGCGSGDLAKEDVLITV